MKSPLQILHLEDDPTDGALVQSTLEAEGIACAINRVETQQDFVAALERGGLDLVLSDYSLPAFNGLAAAEIVRTRWPAIPIILVSGTLGEEQAIDALKTGATDYVLKKRLARLVPAVRRAMMEVDARAQQLQAERAIRSERDFCDVSLNSLPGIFYVFDQAGNFLRWNRNFERISGYSADEITRMAPTDFFTGEERDYIAKKIETVFAKGVVNAEAHFTAKDGTRTPYFFTGQAIQVKGLACLIGCGVDISERKKLEAQFIEAQKMEVVGHLASGVAHDFNNILAVILGYSELLMAELEPANELRKHVGEIRLAGERAAGLTRQLLVFSRKQKVQLVVLDLNDVVGDLDKMLRRLVDENVEMTIVPAKRIGRIKADGGYIGQVLMNLVVNARDAMPNGGRINIAVNDVTLVENDAGKCPGAPPGDYVMLSVNDTGTGMTDEVKARLFEPFFTTKPAGTGTGLGLATCQTIVQQSGGFIVVSGQLGVGTTFKIYFPRVELPLNIPTRAISNEPAPLGTETLLVVEDEPSVRRLAAEGLAALGYQVLAAANGKEALHVAQTHQGAPILLVVTDVVMPLMGGNVMAEWLKTTHPNLKILFTSGYPAGSTAHDGVLAPGVEFLPKPYTPATLARRVRAMLDGETETTFLRKDGAPANSSPPALN